MQAAADVTGKVRVIDGDTIMVGNEKTRLFGIDAPELDQTCTRADGKVWKCGAWVRAEVRRRYQNKIADCEVLDHDRYGRLVGRCWINGDDMGEKLVLDGLAFPYVKYTKDYVDAETRAKALGLGLHSGSYEAPSDYRKSKTGPPPPDLNCPIKGNIGRTGRKIYHMPGQEDYGRTRINVKKGERWFCNEAQARAAGWVPAKR